MICVSFVYFSPTGTTRRVVKIVKKSFHTETMEHDLSDCNYLNQSEKLIFEEEDFVVFAFPVYSGRVPDVFRERLDKLKGNNTIAAVIATYGNRQFGDSLLEMRDIASNAGFHIIGAMTVVTEHSVVHKIAAGRPDEADIRQINRFGTAMQQLISEPADTIRNMKEPELPGHRPYCRYIDLPVTPYSTKKCNGCEACLRACPVGAITYDGHCRTDKRKCFRCMRCVRICPQKARTLGKIIDRIAYLLMKNLTKENKQSQLFFTCDFEKLND